MLFPQLSRRARGPFAVALTVLLLALVVFAVLRWQAALITAGALGPPIVFALFLYVADGGRDAARTSLLMSAVLATGLGVGWVLVTGPVVARSHDVALGADATPAAKLVIGLGVPVGGALMMLLPAAMVVGLRARPGRNPLEGYAVGAFGAVVFTAAATVTRLAPQYATGLTASDRSVGSLLVQAGIQGVAMPLTAAALGRPGPNLVVARRGGRRGIVTNLVVALGLYMVMGVAELLPVWQLLHLGVHLVIAAVALLMLRRAVSGDRRDDPVDAKPTQVLTAFGAVLVVVIAAGLTAAVLATPVVPKVECRPDCGTPPRTSSASTIPMPQPNTRSPTRWSGTSWVTGWSATTTRKTPAAPSPGSG